MLRIWKQPTDFIIMSIPCNHPNSPYPLLRRCIPLPFRLFILETLSISATHYVPTYSLKSQQYTAIQMVQQHMRLHIQFQTAVELPSSCICSIHMAILIVILLEDACGGALSRTICVTYVVATVFGNVPTMWSMQGLVEEQVPEPLEESKRCYWQVFLLFFYLTHCVPMIYPMTIHFTFLIFSFSCLLIVFYFQKLHPYPYSSYLPFS